ncbi:transglutaminase domain-containing protein [Pusillimonas sp. CC-YST705]|uniref:Transglutaminase domain-containing protein n=1 Tax=Mesopusillimonas faecipullorum TaxID=2755040 RepID=A0ABS8C8K5_9BURK|nr:transglutaminase domain-containing protein [Mesopusillimonas faecipullorum]MCB5362355.1 transglutaminase domain-containing protein [Mesopusillimonas faecipullorum]
MDRRSFMINSALLTTAASLAPTLVQAQASVVPAQATSAPRSRRFLLKQTYALKAPQGSKGAMLLWVPVPEDAAPFQHLRQLRWSGDAQDTYLNSDNAYGAKTLVARWDDCTKPMHLNVDMLIETHDWEPGKLGLLNAYQPPAAIHYPPEVARFLESSRHIQTDGIVKEYADRIIGRETNPLKQARLIYDWVSANMERDNSVIGCGVGDVGKILTSGKLLGKCTDMSSVFVALARAAGIPAREMFGIRLGRPGVLEPYSKTAFGSADAQGVSNVTGGQHCRAQFYLAGFGWVPCDPADVTKMRLTEKKKHEDADVQAVNDYLFGNWDMNWVGFNYGRDFLLNPAPEMGPLNNFGYPYAEADGDPLDYYDAATFVYEYLSQEQS